jgi:hypothetical protein
LKKNGWSVLRFISENMLGIVQLGTRKPFSADHPMLWPLQHFQVKVMGFYIEVKPQTLPEIFQIRHRPIPKIMVGAEIKASFDKKPIHVFFEIGLLQKRSPWFP